MQMNERTKEDVSSSCTPSTDLDMLAGMYFGCGIIIKNLHVFHVSVLSCALREKRVILQNTL